MTLIPSLDERHTVIRTLNHPVNCTLSCTVSCTAIHMLNRKRRWVWNRRLHDRLAATAPATHPLSHPRA